MLLTASSKPEKDEIITIPYNWEPRFYQVPLYNSFGYEREFQRAAVIWHRRAGKDSTVLNLTSREMTQRVGTYWHLFPEQTQARKALWNGIDKQGRRIIDQFLPPPIRKRKSDQEMLIEIHGGSIWQMAGSDNYDSLVGSNPVGVVFSEWPLADPQAWEYIRPIIVENGGWALFIYTPRGRNHGWSTYQTALLSDDWFSQKLTIEDTGGVITPEMVQKEIDDGMSEDKAQQEFYCSFEAASEDQMIPGPLIAKARKNIEVSYPQDELIIGVDPARGGDRTVIAIRRGPDARSIPWETFKSPDTMKIVGRLGHLIDELRPDATFIEENGLGGPIYDRMVQLGYNVTSVDVGVEPSGLTKTKVNNKRTECWQRMKEWLQGPNRALPNSDEIEMDLIGPMYDYDPNNAIRLESKEKMKKRGVSSPDHGDALALTFAYPVEAKGEQERQEEIDDQDQDQYDPFRWR